MVAHEEENNVGGVFVHGVFIPAHGYRGTLYRVGEHCLVNEEVMKVSHIFSLSISGTYHIFIKGDIFVQDTGIKL